MKNDRERESGGFVVEVPKTEARELLLIQTKGLIAVWIRLRLEELGREPEHRQFKVRVGKVGKKPTLLINAPAWAKELKLEAHLRNTRRRFKPSVLDGWVLQFNYLDT